MFIPLRFPSMFDEHLFCLDLLILDFDVDEIVRELLLK